MELASQNPVQSSSLILELAGGRSGEGRRKTEAQGVRLAPVLWHEMSVQSAGPKYVGRYDTCRFV